MGNCRAAIRANGCPPNRLERISFSGNRWRKFVTADADVPIKYMDRTRHYYRALGYTQDYIWATFDDVPFSQPAKPLSEMRLVLITTASPLDFDGVKRVG